MKNSLKSFDYEKALEEAKQRFLNFKIKRAKMQAEKQWEHNIGPKVKDFLSGLTVNEVGQKHGVARTELYTTLRQLGLRTRTREAKLLGNIIIKNKRKNETQFRRQLKQCDCFSCSWIKRRLQSFDRYGDSRFGRY